MKLIARIFILALLFAYAFPAIVPGVSIHGGLWPQGLVCGVIFVGVSFLVGILAAIIGIGTLGIGLIVLYCLQMFVPAVTLQLMASWFPDHLTVASWESAIIAGLCIWLVNFVFNRLGGSSSSDSNSK
jgi:hypothetical protein